MAIRDETEIRFMAPLSDVRVLDGYCSGTGHDRSHVMREILHRWADDKLHEATIIVRVAAGNPSPPETGRQGD
jgi:hypothetical protein